MGRFLIRLLGFTAVLLVVLEGVRLSGWYRREVPGAEVYTSLDRSVQSSGRTVLVIGDSVGKQLFDNEVEHADFTSLACNQAVGLAGHYVLLRRFLDANPQTERVYLIYAFSSFRTDLNDQFSYNYFVKPFATAACLPLLTPSVHERIRAQSLWWCSQWTPFKVTALGPRMPKPEREPPLAPITEEYLRRIHDLVVERGCAFAVLPPPVKEGRRDEYRAFQQVVADLPEVRALLGDYAARVVVHPDADFVDHVHLTAPALAVERERMRAMMGLAVER